MPFRWDRVGIKLQLIKSVKDKGDWLPYLCLARCRVEPLSRLLVELQISLIAAVGGRLQSVGVKGIGWSNFLARYYYCLP